MSLDEARPNPVSATITTAFGSARVTAYQTDRGEHAAVVVGDIAGQSDVMVRVHSKCLTGDVFGSLRCDCGPQLDAALHAIASAGAGVVIYLDQEGRGIGLGNKLRAYALQEQGLDTVDANLALGLPVDARDYADAAMIIRHLGVASIRLMTNNPDKVAQLAAAGVRVNQRMPLVVPANPFNRRYLETKASRLGHDLPG